MTRRQLLDAAAVALAAITAASCAGDSDPASGTADDGEARATGRGAGSARLVSRPTASVSARTPPGLHPLAHAALLRVPHSGATVEPRPLVLTLHGAGGSPRNGLGPLLPLADELDLVLLAPKSQHGTWDVIVGRYGADVATIDALLAEAFDRCLIDPRRLAIAGFSDGASYALSLGLANGDLFDAIFAFSPGFSAPPERRGSPSVFISHGTDDPVLPVAGARRIAEQLRRGGYDVRYHEFAGGHAMPPDVVREAVRSWRRRMP